MKKTSTLWLLSLTLLAITTITSCSKDEPIIEVLDNGTTSNGNVVSIIDDANFVLDYIKYTVKDDHLVVSGYDKEGFQGKANIIPRITYKGTTYDVKEIDEFAFVRCTSLTSVNIPSSVTTIKHNAFQGCTGLTAITIPNGVQIIGSDAFQGCTGLTAIAIPSSVIALEGAFPDCTNIESIKVDKNNSRYDSRQNCNAIITTSTNKLTYGCKNTTIPNSVTSIGSFAFSGCTGLTSITIPNSVTTIGICAFGYTGLTSITIPNSVTDIGNGAFWNSTSLTSVTIPNSVTSIKEAVFMDCTSLKSVTIPNSVKTIGNNAFSGCTGLTSIEIPSSVTSIGSGAFSLCNLESMHIQSKTPPQTSIEGSFQLRIDYITLYVPVGSADAYKAATPWKYFKEIIEE